MSFDTTFLRAQFDPAIQSRLQMMELMHLFVQHTSAAVAIFDREMHYLLASQRWMVDYDLVGQELIGRSFADASPEVSPGWHEFQQRCLAGESASADEAPFRRADGSNGWQSWEMHPWHEEDEQVGGIIIFSEDISERKQAADALTKRATEFASVAEVSTAVASAATTHEMLQQAADLTKFNFDLYHAHVYTLNEQTKELILVAGAGEVGRQMVHEGRRIPMDSKQSLVARAARTRRGVIVNDVKADRGFLPHPLLPYTRSEMAVPLLAGEQLLGVLDVQAAEVNHFSSEDINIQTTLAAQIAVALQNARQHEQTEATLEELNVLQRMITREGWQAFMTVKDRPIQGYRATNEQALQPITASGIAGDKEETTPAEAFFPEESLIITPMKVRGSRIGALGIKSSPGEPLSAEHKELLESISQEVAEALERARLAEQTEFAREQTAALYAGSDRVVRATTIDGILQALVDSTALQRMDQANLLLFDRIWDDEPPDYLTVTALWERSGAPPGPAVGSIYLLNQFPFLSLLVRDEPMAIRDIATDQRADPNLRRFLQEMLGMRSVIFFPLVVGGNWIGMITAQSSEVLDLKEDEIRQISSLADQAAAMSQTQHLLASAQRRARHEQILRRITAKVSGSVDVDTVMRTAVEDIGRALGRRAFVRLEPQAQQPHPLVETKNGASNG
jgi:PAS domain S-box-containing protein